METKITKINTFFEIYLDMFIESLLLYDMAKIHEDGFSSINQPT